MGHGHSHRAGSQGDDVVVEALPRRILLTVLALVAVATVVGTVLLWPDGARADELKGSVGFAAEGVTFPEAEITAVADGSISATVAEGTGEGTDVVVQVPPQVSDSGLVAGDRLELVRTPAAEGAEPTYAYFGTERSGSLWILLVAFVVVVLVVARLRGVLALLGLGFSAAVVWLFVLPGLLTGESAVLVSVVGAVAILYVVLYTTHGFSIRTSAALAGTLGGLAVTAAIGRWAVGDSRLAGISDESSGILSTFAEGLDFQGLLVAAIVVAGVGVLNDVTITQASAVWELRSASPQMSRAQVFTSAMRIGRDHIASTIYTIVFVYLGTALTLLMIIQLYDRPVVDLVGTEEIATEVIRSLTSSIGLVLAVPLTTFIATVTVPGATREGLPAAPAA